MSLTRSYEQDSWTLCEDGRTILSVRETEEDGRIRVFLSGALRSDAAHVFKDELIALMTVGKDVELDLEGVEYISSSCQDALLSTQQTADEIDRGTLTLRHVPTAIYAEFQKTNLN